MIKKGNTYLKCVWWVSFFFFENSFKILVFIPKFSVNFYNPFKLFPCREMFTLCLKSIWSTFVFWFIYSCLHLLYLYSMIPSLKGNETFRFILSKGSFEGNLKDFLFTMWKPLFLQIIFVFINSRWYICVICSYYWSFCVLTTSQSVVRLKIYIHFETDQNFTNIHIY